jgi:hypothetical protein
MANLAQKLGIKPGMRVCLLGAPDAAQQAIRSAAPSGVKLALHLEDPIYDMILFWPTSREGLARLFAELQQLIRPDGAVWAVMPKKVYARQRGIDFNWEELQAAGLHTDLVDNKVASITVEDYGTRFVIRKDRRAKRSESGV